jgi:hypothetical protein
VSPPVAPAFLADRYDVEGVLGEGAQAVTYAAKDKSTGAPVALKVFSLSAVRDYKQLELFRRECAVLKQLNHPGVPRFVEDLPSPDGAQHVLVMSRVPGQSLKDRVAQGGPLPEEELWRVLREGASVLAYLHGQTPPVVHRDIKPSHLLQDQDGHLTLVDFGVVQVSRAEEGTDRTFVGTYGYMAPEQFRGDALPATDVYALGATVLALATGKAPEDLPHEGQRLDVGALGSLSAELKVILARMTDPDPANRPRDGAALEDLLGVKADEEGTALDGAQALPPPLRLGVGALLTLVGMLGFVMLSVARMVVAPLVFMIIGMVSKQDKVALKEREREVEALLGDGAYRFRKLASGGYLEAQAGRAALEAQQERNTKFQASPYQRGKQTRVNARAEQERQRQRMAAANRAQRGQWR